MGIVRIAGAAVAHPPLRIGQAEAARHIGAFVEDQRRVAALARGTRIASRAIALPAEELAALGGIEERNGVYHRIAPALARAATEAVLPPGNRRALAFLATSSCTGYTVPGWAVDLVEDLSLPYDTVRLPITEAGCAGGVVALSRAADYLRGREGKAALAVAVEVCSLAFHPGGGDGNVTASLIFGDGAGAARLETGGGPGLEVVDTLTHLIPGTKALLGFDLTDRGFYPVLARELVDALPAATERAVSLLLGRNGLCAGEIGAWLLHPGGARILAGLERALGLRRERTRWSWDSMREFGNTSSAGIFDVLRRYIEEGGPPGRWAVICAFGPGVSVELMLVRSC
ncbi:MAG: type III polyketide synthase [Tepidiformaceae bacterium]